MSAYYCSGKNVNLYAFQNADIKIQIIKFDLNVLLVWIIFMWLVINYNQILWKQNYVSNSGSNYDY
jgi:hypothetical protein